MMSQFLLNLFHLQSSNINIYFAHLILKYVSIKTITNILLLLKIIQQRHYYEKITESLINVITIT